MAVVDLQVARDHLRVDSGYPDAQITRKLAAAERLAAEYMGRRIYVDADALADAVAAVPATLTAAGLACDAARETAYDIEDAATQEAALEYAEQVYRDAKTAARETYAGIVINEQIEAGILIALTSLHDENRGGAGGGQSLPDAARELLHPFRVGLGV